MGASGPLSTGPASPASGGPLSGGPLSGGPLSGGPLSGGPPSGGGTHGPQMPLVPPTGTTHVSPGQQSALMVHAPQLGTHASWEQMNGGVPLGLGTQGSPLQQLALEAQAPPGITHCTGPQR